MAGTPQTVADVREMLLTGGGPKRDNRSKLSRRRAEQQAATQEVSKDSLTAASPHGMGGKQAGDQTPNVPKGTEEQGVTDTPALQGAKKEADAPVTEAGKTSVVKAGATKKD